MSNDTAANVLVLHTVHQVRQWREQQRVEGKTVGFVATMGALHEGHLSLVQAAAAQCSSVIVSIFVNPTQFAPHEDLDKYPRTLSDDIRKLPGGTVVFAPSVAEMYPRKQAFVEVLGLSEMLEGVTRPHFFRGVATVVSRLFNIVEPNYAFFGQKDIQQCCVLRALVEDMHFNLKMVVVPTERYEDGLALSSRNVYLTAEQRARAPAFYRGLCRAQQLFESGVVDRKALTDAVKDEAAKGDLDLEYVCLSNPNDLKEVDVVDSQGAILSGAWRMGTTRLIDNILIGFEF
ncbi:pantoate-beta-alanine ligase [Coemansia sp. RSA 989]|nr:Pantoate-beta-alanine ligase [Coemansia mojavensis]KAJ1738303.1 pantoate-beta-alanine ligase [Coemansia sp. RSA 1086]KAJ1863910.1 pantoate-beta-alanine ligase [Coemansia sp. RSA 989]KAJ1871636.1 pantoate-beta-alanine ligase [Coemansia sp. RSA 990]KAJ2674321.1 pantoate-beta-alanine ligase [Coemansia sp. RSA 1085]